jgi:hypothetical protein
MAKRPIIGIHIATGVPIELSSHDRLIGKHVIVGGALYGRILFAQPLKNAVTAEGHDIEIKHCIIEFLDGYHRGFLSA